MKLFSTSIFILGTLYLAGCMVLTSKMFIDERNMPGGPAAVIVAVYSQPPVMMANVSFAMQRWLADFLIIYRCLVIYTFRYWAIAFPALLLLGSFICGTLLLVQTATPNVGFWSKISVNLAIPSYSFSISLNIIVTLLIVIRLLMYRQNLKAVLGSEYTKDYASISAMLIESAALTTGSFLIFLILYARGNPVSNVFQGLAFYCQITASLLIVLRVAQGRGWSQDTAKSALSSMKFNPMSRPAAPGPTQTIPRDNFRSSYSSDTNIHVELGHSINDVGIDTVSDALPKRQDKEA
ncbi:hypothetical protein K439DRAFT_1647725 [Ramaria rubella]|nr:hypothetical protein K439DRAFT_1647725 [Ramaria rubella]